MTPALCPCAVSMTIASTPASNNAFARSKVSEVMPTAAATNNRPCSSFAELGNSITFSISLMVINPDKFPFSSTRGSFSILCLCKILSASFKEVPTGAVINGSFVITSSISIE